MGLFDTIKNKLGIGGVSIDFTVPSQVDRATKNVNGQIRLTTKSEQEIVKMEAILEEEFQTGMGDNKTEKKFELGKWTNFDQFSIKPGEVKTFDFDINFEEIKSASDKMAEKSGAFGALGKGVKFLNNEKSRYFVVINVDVKSAVLDPTEKKEVKLV